MPLAWPKSRSLAVSEPQRRRKTIAPTSVRAERLAYPATMDLDAVRAILGNQSVITDPDRLAGHTIDWTGRFRGRATALVTPRSTNEVAALLRWCSDHSVPVVPQGGNTGLVGGSVPLDGEIILSLRNMTDITDRDSATGQLTAMAGATVAHVQEAADRIGWAYGVDFGARDTATIGGSIATNAGGMQVMRHGDTRRQVLGIEAVTALGEVVGDLRGLVKDNTGYHLPSLICGSEGTLAVVTRARLALVPQPADIAVALVGFPDIGSAVSAISELRRRSPDVRAIEIFFQAGLDLVCRHEQIAPPFADAHDTYLVVEAAGPPGVAERLAAGPLGDLVAAESVALAQDSGRRAALWRYREGHTASIGAEGVAHKLDVTVPLESLAGFAADVGPSVQAVSPEARIYMFGHGGDGNLHVNVLGPDPDDMHVDEAVFALVAERGGSISAEHGIGRAKANHLHINRRPDELEIYRRIKAAFDPRGILNPGVLLT